MFKFPKPIPVSLSKGGVYTDHSGKTEGAQHRRTLMGGNTFTSCENIFSRNEEIRKALQRLLND